MATQATFSVRQWMKSCRALYVIPCISSTRFLFRRLLWHAPDRRGRTHRPAGFLRDIEKFTEYLAAGFFEDAFCNPANRCIRLQSGAGSVLFDDEFPVVAAVFNCALELVAEFI